VVRYNRVVSAGEQLSSLGRYELVTQIGHGGMAEVQLALQRGPAGFEKLVVIKLVHKNLARQKTFVDMLLDEARVAALVKHPNVVDIYDLGEVDGRYFIAMEYLEGEPLLSLLRAGRDGKRLDPMSTARLIADTAEGLDAAHELQSIGGDPIELVHHDVSLGNIMVLYNGQVKLVDFGVAKATQNAGPQMKVHGKFGYMAPEKLRGRGSDRRGDIWSLGVVLWEALTLRRLFRGANEQDTMRLVLEHPIRLPSQVNKDSLPELDAIAMRALERDPARRYSRAKELARDIEEVLRLKGYGGRNDQIATYMQETFQAHIVARKKLLHEVINKGKASADVLEAAFDEAQVGGIAGRAVRKPAITGEFAIAFRPHGDERARTSNEMLAESSDVADILHRRSSEEMMAEGTPHSAVKQLPKRITQQMFAEATPVETDPDIPPFPDHVRRGDSQFERARTAPIAGEGFVIAPKPEHAAGDSMESAAVLAMVASLEPVVSEARAPMPAGEDEDDGDAGETLIQVRRSKESPPGDPPATPKVSLDEKLDPETKQTFGALRQQALGRSVSSVLDRWGEPPREPVGPRAVESRTIDKRITSQRLQVIKKPPTQRFDAPVIVLADNRPSKLPMIILAVIAVLALAAVAVLLLIK